MRIEENERSHSQEVIGNVARIKLPLYFHNRESL